MPKQASVVDEMAEKIAAVAKRYDWSRNKANGKIAVTQVLKGLGTAEEAADFLLGPAQEAVLCDGCNVRGCFEHRCHNGSGRVMVRGERSDKRCQCPTCFVINELGIS